MHLHAESDLQVASEDRKALLMAAFDETEGFTRCNSPIDALWGAGLWWQHRSRVLQQFYDLPPRVRAYAYPSLKLPEVDGLSEVGLMFTDLNVVPGSGADPLRPAAGDLNIVCDHLANMI